MDKIRLVQKKSSIGRTQKIKDTLRSLLLGKIGQSSILDCTPELLGRVDVVKDMIEVHYDKAK